MTHNDVLRAIRYLLNVSDAGLRDIVGLGGGAVSPEDIEGFLKKEEEPGHRPCTEQAMGHFLNGLVIYKRGKDERRPPRPVEVPITNNVILKSLRIAFELTDSDIIELIAKTGLRVSKAELSAFFRRADHRNYRDCGDQFLRNLLKGLSSNAATMGSPPFPISPTEKMS